MSNLLTIKFGTSYKTKKSDSLYNDDGKRAYRIHIQTPKSSGVFPFKFAREKDAQAGINALLKHIDLYNLTEFEIRSKLKELGPLKVREIICSELNW
jgi:hypothetical protein